MQVCTPEALFQAVGGTEAAALENFRIHWEASLAARPAGTPHFLQEAFIREQFLFLGTEEAKALLGPSLRTAAAIRADEELCTLAWHFYWRTYLSPAPYMSPGGWPEPPQLGEDRGMLYFLVALAFTELVRALHRGWNIPVEITRDTCGQVARYCMDNYRRGNQGRLGIYQSQLSWMRHYTLEPYFRIGRLEYWLKPSKVNVNIYRNRKDGRTVAFPDAGTRFTPDGYSFSDPADYEATGSWLSELGFENDCVVGHPYNPSGFAERRKVALPLKDWELVFTKGSYTFNMHIPSGGKMTPEACRQSLLQARDFFRKYFPDKPVRAGTCGSWIFNTQLEEIFPETANLVRFQRELYLFPNPSGPWDGLWFIFLQSGKPEFASAPRDTDLQRRVLDWLQAGHRWRTGSMFILMDDLESFGTQLYRRQWRDNPL